MSKKAYHITQWDTLYETAASRKVVTLSYYSKPNKLVGEGIGATLAQEDAEALLGTWALMEALASTAPFGFRGWLVRNGSALDAPRMAALTHRPKDKFVRALEWFSQPEIGWLEHVELPASFPTKPPSKETTGGLSGESPTKPPSKEKPPEAPPAFRHDDEVRKGSEGSEISGGKNKGAARGGEVAASRTQWAVLKNQIKELESLGQSLEPAQRMELRKKKAQFREVEKRQADGDFSTVQTSGGEAA